MARAIISTIASSEFGVPVVRDDVTNGWYAAFEVFYIGEGAAGGFQFDRFDAHFLDADGALAMDNKIRDAARARAAELGIAGAASMIVISFLPPRRL